MSEASEGKPIEPRKACGTCKFSEVGKDIRFVVCRRMPPSPVTVPVKQGAATGFIQLGFCWPTMPRAEWCHEYKPRGEFTFTSYPQDNEGSKQ